MNGLSLMNIATVGSAGSLDPFAGGAFHTTRSTFTALGPDLMPSNLRAGTGLSQPGHAGDAGGAVKIDRGHVPGAVLRLQHHSRPDVGRIAHRARAGDRHTGIAGCEKIALIQEHVEVSGLAL